MKKANWIGGLIASVVLLILAVIKIQRQNDENQKISQGYIDFATKMSKQMAKEQQKIQAEKEKK